MRRTSIALVLLAAAASAGFVSRLAPAASPQQTDLGKFLERTPPLGNNIHENNCTGATPAFGFNGTLDPNAHFFDCVQDGPYTAASGPGWYRQRIRGLHVKDVNASGQPVPCPDKHVGTPCDLSVVRVCHMGGAGQTSPCKYKGNALTGGQGCAICVAPTYLQHTLPASSTPSSPPAPGKGSASTS